MFEYYSLNLTRNLQMGNHWINLFTLKLNIVLNLSYYECNSNYLGLKEHRIILSFFYSLSNDTTSMLLPQGWYHLSVMTDPCFYFYTYIFILTELLSWVKVFFLSPHNSFGASLSISTSDASVYVLCDPAFHLQLIDFTWDFTWFPFGSWKTSFKNNTEIYVGYFYFSIILLITKSLINLLTNIDVTKHKIICLSKA